MVRTNNQGQGDRSEGGSRFEAAMFKRIESFLEATKLDDCFQVIRYGTKEKIECVNPPLLPKAPYEGRIPVASPDLSIRWIGSAEVVVYFGCKASFRERSRQDDRDAILVYPVPWIELTQYEKSSETTAHIENRIDIELTKSVALWMIASSASQDAMNHMFLELEKFLRNLAQA